MIPLLILAGTVLLTCAGVVMATRNVTRVERRVARCEEELAAMRRHPCNHPAGSRPPREPLNLEGDADTTGKDRPAVGDGDQR